MREGPFARKANTNVSKWCHCYGAKTSGRMQAQHRSGGACHQARRVMGFFFFFNILLFLSTPFSHCRGSIYEYSQNQ